MIVLKNKTNTLDFYTFNTRGEAIDFLNTLPKRIRKEYEIVKPIRNAFEVLKVR